MVGSARGLVLAFALFAASFVLHIVGGATDQGWLFAIAVALIFLTAAAFPAIALALARVTAPAERRAAIGAGALVGVVLTASALWAANGRAFAWWEPPLAAALVATVSSAAWFAWQRVTERNARSSRTSAARRRPAAS